MRKVSQVEICLTAWCFCVIFSFCLSLPFLRPLWSPSHLILSLDWSISTCSARLGPCTASSTTHFPISMCPILNLEQCRRTLSKISLSAGKNIHNTHFIFEYLYCILKQILTKVEYIEYMVPGTMDLLDNMRVFQYTAVTIADLPKSFKWNVYMICSTLHPILNGKEVASFSIEGEWFSVQEVSWRPQQLWSDWLEVTGCDGLLILLCRGKGSKTAFLHSISFKVLHKNMASTVSCVLVICTISSQVNICILCVVYWKSSWSHTDHVTT